LQFLLAKDLISLFVSGLITKKNGVLIEHFIERSGFSAKVSAAIPKRSVVSGY
jgi:hypothetical protein